MGNSPLNYGHESVAPFFGPPCIYGPASLSVRLYVCPSVRHRPSQVIVLSNFLNVRSQQQCRTIAEERWHSEEKDLGKKFELWPLADLGFLEGGDFGNPSERALRGCGLTRE